MDELHNRLLGEHDAGRSSISDIRPESLAQVRRGARRRRQVRAIATSAASVLTVGAIGMGAWGLAGMDRADGLQPMVSDTPTPIETPVPRVSADAPAPTVPPAPPADPVTVTDGPPLDDSPDGIPEDGYPELAADRNNAKTAATEITYPRAHVMKDWVWDRVGPGWALDTASVQFNPYESGWEQPPAVVYLVSPEDRYFEVTELPKRAWDDVRVVSWREAQGTAMLWWANDGTDHGRTGGGGALDLRTGELDNLRMAVYGDMAHDYRFVTGNAAGVELWRAESDNGFKFYRWRDGTGGDGWVASALVDQLPTADNAVFTIGYQDFVVTENGDRVLLSTGSDGHSGPPRTEIPLVTYDLSSDSISRHPLSLPVEVGDMAGFAFVGANTVVGYFNAHPDSSNDVREHPLYQEFVRVTLAGSETTIEATGSKANYWHDIGRPIPYGGASPRGVGADDCGC